MLVVYGDTHEEDQMYHPFNRELAAERIADLLRQAEHDRPVARTATSDRSPNQPRLCKLLTANRPRTSATWAEPLP